MKEEWRPVKGFEGLYEVSNLGRVRSLDRKYTISRERYHGGINKKGKIITGYKGEKHYCQVCLFREGKKSYAQIHRMVAEAFIPNPENKRQVNHKDGIKQNNVVTNLEWVTPSENILHSFEAGLNTHIGEKNIQAKLTRDQVAEIKKAYVKGSKEYGVRPLARKYGVSAPAIRAIVKGLTWRGVTI